MTIVVDSSVMVAALIDQGPVGQWAEELLMSGPLAAPHLMPVEAANILRRSALAGDISADVASLAHQDLKNGHARQQLWSRRTRRRPGPIALRLVQDFALR